MAEFQRTQLQTDEGIETRRSGSVALTLGGIFLGMAALVGVLTFSAMRDGDKVWPAFTGIMVLIGVVLLFKGTIGRHRPV